jgi:hypothetical protein
MKKLVVAPMLLIGFSTLIISCASLTSTRYVDANIRIGTNPRVVSGMQFVDGWSTQAGTAYSAQNVAVMIANDMAGKGWQDVMVLAES